MPTALNDHFAENMTGKIVSFDVQPYKHGIGTITKIEPRKVERKTFDGERGGQWVEYECYDLTIKVHKGSHTGAFSCGVPMPNTTRDLAGEETNIVGVSYGQVRRAALEGMTIIQATCG